jgi:HAD superfamily hydrolase (TIGR01457 family)
MAQSRVHLALSASCNLHKTQKMIITGFHPDTIKALILDMDGVLWRGSEPIGNLNLIFKQIQKNNLKVTFVTNNGSRTILQYVDLLSSFGVSVQPWQVISSAIAASEYLKQNFPSGGSVYIIGEQGVIEACTEYGFYQSEKDAIAVIVGIDRKLTYDKLKIATLLIRSGVPFIGTNPDKTFPTPIGLVPGAGSILAAIETATSVTPIIVGKPEPTMYQIALQRLSISASQALVVGDRPETDIAGAQALGCQTALVLSGVTNKEQAYSWKPSPDIIANDLETLVNLSWESGT